MTRLTIRDDVGAWGAYLDDGPCVATIDPEGRYWAVRFFSAEPPYWCVTFDDAVAYTLVEWARISGEWKATSDA